MNIESNWVRPCLLLAMLAACQGRADVVAAASGDYEPNHPPQMLALTGDVDAHNPTLFRAGESYYLYHSGLGILAKRSLDMVEFTSEPAVFDENPSWIATLVPDATALWSPSVATFGGRLHLYFAASTFGSDRSCIGHATSTTVGEGFTDQGAIVCSNLTDGADDFNAIDPGIFLDSEHEPWLVFGSYLSGIKLIALDATGKRRDTVMVSLATRPSDTPEIQAPELVKWKGYYYLFASFDLCCNGSESTYRIMVGRSRSITGPYLDRDGVDMLNGGGTLVVQSGARWRGPGSNMLYVEGEKRYNVYHAYDADANGRATLRISELYFDDDGWPVTAGP